MASPKKHAFFTGVLIVLYAAPFMLGLIAATKHHLLIGLGIIAMGILIDADHLIDILKLKISRRLIYLIRHRKLVTQNENWVNRFHTLFGAVIIMVVSLAITKSWWLIIAYGLHIFIDACNKANEIAPRESPLVNWLYEKVVKKYFRFLLYNYHPTNQQPRSPN